ncbi:MAG: DUF2949 domain-containing protein [Thermosynechococcaceae cyanobacterium]
MLLAKQARFIQFLQNDLNLSPDAISVADKSSRRDQGPLSVVLWQYGLVTLEQLNIIFEWLERDR